MEANFPGRGPRSIEDFDCERSEIISSVADGLKSIISGGVAMLASLLSPKSMMEAAGQSLAPLAANQIASLMHAEEVLGCDDQGMIVSHAQAKQQPAGTPSSLVRWTSKSVDEVARW